MVGQHIFEKACVLRQQGRYLEALDAYTQAIEAGLENADAYHRRADTYALLGLYREAVRDYDRAIELGRCPLRIGISQLLWDI